MDRIEIVVPEPNGEAGFSRFTGKMAVDRKKG